MASITARITKQVKSHLPQILPKQVSSFALLSTYEAAASLIEFKLKNILIDKIDENKDKDEDPFAGSDREFKKRKTSTDAEPKTCPKTKDSKSGSTKGTKSQSKSFGKSVQSEELEFEVADFDMPQVLKVNLVTRVEVMRKHVYGYLREIEVQRVDNDLYTFKEGDFLRLLINDIEGMLILIVQNRLTNLSGGDLGVESYQKKIKITKPETTRPGLRLKDPYTPYQDPQGFIYVDTLRRNRLTRSNELYKFSDGTLTRPRTSLDDITKTIQMEYLPQRRWSLLEKKRANIMIKEINKQLKEKRMMRIFKNQNRRDLPMDILLVSVEVHRYDIKRSKSEDKGRVSTEMELVLEQTQQGTSYEVLVSAEGVEELKREVKIKGEKKEALLILRQKLGQYICCQNHKDDC
uniref:Uncharacterized protein n=1 Tax=Tanacetum cinerariifolium TaxID=118510 RepID=A0A6L2KIG0_TANCI|nr:hypothetical protein [Tanacetum cinerariifolium]